MPDPVVDPNNPNPNPEPNNPDPNPNPNPEPNPNPAEPQPVDLGFTQEQLQEEYDKNEGKLSDETLKALKAKLPEAMVDNYMEGLAAIRDKNETAAKAEAKVLYDAVGGRDGFNDLNEWIGDNLTEEEVTELQGVLDNKSIPQNIKALALKDVHTRMKEAVGVDPNLLEGEGGGTVDPEKGPITQAEYFELRQDKRYIEGSAFQKQVDARRMAHPEFRTLYGLDQ